MAENREQNRELSPESAPGIPAQASQIQPAPAAQAVPSGEHPFFDAVKGYLDNLLGLPSSLKSAVDRTRVGNAAMYAFGKIVTGMAPAIGAGPHVIGKAVMSTFAATQFLMAHKSLLDARKAARALGEASERVDAEYSKLAVSSLGAQGAQVGVKAEAALSDVGEAASRVFRELEEFISTSLASGDRIAAGIMRAYLFIARGGGGQDPVASLIESLAGSGFLAQLRPRSSSPGTPWLMGVSVGAPAGPVGVPAIRQGFQPAAEQRRELSLVA